MRAYIFGAFNPPTNAHIEMGKAAQKALDITNPGHVIYIPSGDAYLQEWKKYGREQIMPADERYKLLKNTLYELGFGYNVAKLEVQGITRYTYDTMKYLGFRDSFLCLGADNVVKMKKWYRYEELLTKISLLIFERPGQDDLRSREAREILGTARSHIIVPLPDDCTGMSSSRVRELVNKAETVDDMEQIREFVPETVFRYLLLNTPGLKPD